jgi:hypothetical protein
MSALILNPLVKRGYDSTTSHFLTETIISLEELVTTVEDIYVAKAHFTVSGTSVSSMSVFWIWCIVVLGSWKVPEQCVLSLTLRRLRAISRTYHNPMQHPGPQGPSRAVCWLHPYPC